MQIYAQRCCNLTPSLRKTGYSLILSGQIPNDMCTDELMNGGELGRWMKGCACLLARR